jgi:hypothetical protein
VTDLAVRRATFAQAPVTDPAQRTEGRAVMRSTLAHKLIGSHLVSGEMIPGAEIAIRIDQTLPQDATGHW